MGITQRILMIVGQPVFQVIIFLSACVLVIAFLASGYTLSWRRFKQQLREAGARKRKDTFTYLTNTKARFGGVNKTNTVLT